MHCKLLPAAILILLGASACQQKPLHKDPEGAIKKCLAGVAELSRGGMGPESKSVVLASACKDLYVETTCQKAFENAGALPPDKRTISIAEVCRKAYCPKLREPKPEMCTMPGLPANPMRLLPLWGELQWAILSRDLGARHASRLYARMMFAQMAIQPILVETPLRLELPKKKPALATESILLTITQDKEKVRVMVNGKEQAAWPANEKPLSGVFKPLTEAMRGESESPQVILKADKNVLYEHIDTLMDRLKSSGFENFVFAVSEDHYEAPGK